MQNFGIFKRRLTMSKKTLFPKEVIENSYEQIVADMKPVTKFIYVTILIALLGISMASFFISVEIGVTANGIIKPIGEHILVTAPHTGNLQKFNWQIGEYVKKGDTLLVVKSQSIDVSLPALQQRRCEIEAMLADLGHLVKGHKPPTFQSPNYIKQYNYYHTELENASVSTSVARKSWERARSLYHKGFIATAEFEVEDREYKQHVLNEKHISQKQVSEWQSEKTHLEEELRNILAQIKSIDIQNAETVVLCPTDASIHQLFNVKEGSYVHNSQQLIELSPEGELLAECYVSTKDIGLIQIDMPVRIRVDAFDYTQWGIIEGKVARISPDIVTIENGNYYQVYCVPNHSYLQLKNGFKGYLKKGMGISTRIVVTERTVFQLLYDKIDNWLNPTVKIK